MEGEEELFSPHPQQLYIARKLLDRVVQVYEKENCPHAKPCVQCALSSRFNDVEYLIVTPPRCNLVEQTKKRMTKKGLDLKENVIMYLRSGIHPKILREFLTNICLQPQTLHVLVADECHWGLKKEGANDLTINNNTILSHDNVIVLLVSATPYNVLTEQSRLLMDDIHLLDWHHGTTFDDMGFKETIEGEATYLRLEAAIQSMDSDTPIIRHSKKLTLEELTAQYVVAMIYRAMYLGETLDATIQSRSWDERVTAFWDAIGTTYSWDKQRFSQKDEEAIFEESSLRPYIEELMSQWAAHLHLSRNSDEFHFSFLKKRQIAEEKGLICPLYTETDAIVRTLSPRNAPAGDSVFIRLGQVGEGLALEGFLKQTRDLCGWKSPPLSQSITLGDARRLVRRNGAATVLLDTGRTPLSASQEPQIEILRSGAEHSRKESCIRNAKSQRITLTLEDVPPRSIVILVQKGGFGDTFPSDSFRCLDLRLCNPPSTLSTLVQGLGRICKYQRDRTKWPYILASEKTIRMLRRGLYAAQAAGKVDALCRLDIKIDRFVEEAVNQVYSQFDTLSGHTAPAKMSYDLDNILKHDRRFLLLAEPQIGKTDAFLQFIKNLQQVICGVGELAARDAEPLPDKIVGSADDYPYWQMMSPFVSYSQVTWNRRVAEAMEDRLRLLEEASREGSKWLTHYFTSLVRVYGIECARASVLFEKAMEQCIILQGDLNDRFCPIQFNGTSRIPRVGMHEMVISALDWDRRLSPSAGADVLNWAFQGSKALRPLEESLDTVFHMDCLNKVPPVSSALGVMANQQGSSLQRPPPFLAPSNRTELTLLCSDSASFQTASTCRISVPGDDVLNARYGYSCMQDIFVVEENVVVGLADTKRLFSSYWIFTPSYAKPEFKRDAYLQLNYSPQEKERLHVVVVRASQFDHYVRTWGTDKIIISQPDRVSLSRNALIRECTEQKKSSWTDEEGGVGLARLFIQHLAFQWHLSWIWMLDDDILYTSKLQRNPDDFSLQGEQCHISELFDAVENLLVDKPFDECDQILHNGFHERRFEKDWDIAAELQSQRLQGISPSGLMPRMRFLEAEDDRVQSSWEYMSIPAINVGVIGVMCRGLRELNARPPLQPWTSTSWIESLYFVNIHRTSTLNAWFYPRRYWENTDFCQVCRSQGLFAVRWNLFAYSKVHSDTLPRPASNNPLYRWNASSQFSAEEMAVSTDLSPIHLWMRRHFPAEEGTTLNMYAVDEMSTVIAEICDESSFTFVPLGNSLTALPARLAVYCNVDEISAILSILIPSDDQLYLNPPSAVTILLVVDDLLSYSLSHRGEPGLMSLRRFWQPIVERLQMRVEQFDVWSILPGPLQETHQLAFANNSSVALIKLQLTKNEGNTPQAERASSSFSANFTIVDVGDSNFQWRVPQVRNVSPGNAKSKIQVNLPLGYTIRRTTRGRNWLMRVDEKEGIPLFRAWFEDQPDSEVSGPTPTKVVKTLLGRNIDSGWKMMGLSPRVSYEQYDLVREKLASPPPSPLSQSSSDPTPPPASPPSPSLPKPVNLEETFNPASTSSPSPRKSSGSSRGRPFEVSVTRGAGMWSPAATITRKVGKGKQEVSVPPGYCVRSTTKGIEWEMRIEVGDEGYPVFLGTRLDTKKEVRSDSATSAFKQLFAGSDVAVGNGWDLLGLSPGTSPKIADQVKRSLE